jgi:hypothetical protein
MRLINASTLELENFSDGEVPSYAILSHTWGPDKDEVTFLEMRDASIRAQLRGRPGFRKIQKTCEIAQAIYGLEYAWVDTCAIDKSSSAELSEAINSMFAWYKSAHVCLVYLGDLERSDVSSWEKCVSSMRHCKWFTRGWTLQELLAPQHVDFFDCNWLHIGSRSTPDLKQAISNACGVSFSALTKQVDLSTIPVAVRMSWASQRITKRPEDRAYCLLGIFDVNMPLLYGEGGEKAFIRLQEEIIKESIDMSIFAWPSFSHGSEYMGMLATSPAQFASMGSVVARPQMMVHPPEFSITNRGIRFLASIKYIEEGGYFIMPVYHDDLIRNHALAISLRQTGPDHYVRARSNLVATLPLIDKPQSLHIAKKLSSKQSAMMEQLSLQVILSPLSDFGKIVVSPIGCFDTTRRMLIPDYNGSFLGYIEFIPPWAGEFDSFVIVCRCDGFADTPWEYDLIRGDDWIDMRDKYRNKYTLRTSAFGTPRRAKKLVLRHLFDEIIVKVVQAEFGYDDGSWRLMLELATVDYDEAFDNHM